VRAPAPLVSIARGGKRLAKRVLPSPVKDRLAALLRGPKPPPVGRVNMGDLARLDPVSSVFGFDRGLPIDRLYIEDFLAAHSGDIRGRVLEVGDDSYCRRFGAGITRQDVLHVSPDNPKATIVGDLSHGGILPEAAFDCLVITQTLQYLFDMPRAVSELRRSLAPGGVLLLTVPGVSSVDRGEWGSSWYWSLTAQSATRLFENEFGAGNVEIGAHGNVYAATCFLQGLAVEEVDRSWLRKVDPAYPLIVTVRARKGG